MPLKNTKRCFRHVSYYNDGVKNKKNLINSNLIKASQLEAERGQAGGLAPSSPTQVRLENKNKLCSMTCGRVPAKGTIENTSLLKKIPHYDFNMKRDPSGVKKVLLPGI